MFELNRLATSLEHKEQTLNAMNVRLTLVEEQFNRWHSREVTLAKLLASTVCMYVLYRLTGIAANP